jgi:hypothetical protein
MTDIREGQRITLREGVYEVDHLSLNLVRDNAATLLRQGVYDRALLKAFINTNHATWSLADLRSLFEMADRARLRAEGDQLPGPGPFTLYRGVAGPEPDRRVSGLSWTHSVEDARWFAQNHARRLREWISDPDPAVCRVTVDAAAVLVYTNVHEEQEFIVMLSPGITPERIE